jgi:hypothetical protein
MTYGNLFYHSATLWGKGSVSVRNTDPIRQAVRCVSASDGCIQSVYNVAIWPFILHTHFRSISQLIWRVNMRIISRHLYNIFILLSGVGTTCFSSWCDKDSAILFYNRPPAWRQPSLGMEWALTTANAGTNGLMCLSKHGEAWDNKFDHPSDDRPLLRLLSFCDRTPSTLNTEPSSSSHKFLQLFSLKEAYESKHKNS